MISVIIPTCDRPAEFLRVAIDSVLLQSLQPHEVILVDNGKNDVDSKELPEGVRLYRLPAYVGVSRARNFGAAMATSPHIAFLDDDDWWDVNFLREAWSVMQAGGARCIYGRKDAFRNGRIERYKVPSKETLTISDLLNRNPGTGGQNLLIEKCLFWEIGGFDESLLTSEDKALAIEVLLAGQRIDIAPEAAAILRAHDGPRLRHKKKYRLRFIWRYRHLYGTLGTLSKALRLIFGIIADYFRGLFRRSSG